MSEIQYNTEIKRGWRIILVDESGTDILHGYSRDKAEKHAKKIIDQYNAFEEGGIVEELKWACKKVLQYKKAAEEGRLNKDENAHEYWESVMSYAEAALTKS